MAVTKRKVVTRKTKTKTATSSVRIGKTAEEKYIGSEIVAFEGVDAEKAIKQNLRHYNYFYNRQDVSPWIAKWIQKNLSATALKEFKAAETWRSCVTIGGVCRMHSNGAKFSKERLDWLKAKIEDEILRHGRAILSASKPSQSSNRVPPSTLVKRKGDDIIANIEAVVDSWDKLETPYSLYNELKSNEVPAIIAKSIGDYYSPLLNELKQVIIRKPDEQLKQAYSHMKLAELKRYAAFIETLVTDAQTYVNGKKAQAKPRTRKAKSAGQLVSKVKYLKESKELKVTSVSPEKIIGAQVAILFNTKYNSISYLVSSSKTGFTITGTTIQNLDMEQSFKKTVRKANENLLAIAVAPKAKATKMIESLTTARQATTGRINEDTLIVKVG